ncbi:hypothetical protein ACY0IW_14530, partial [Clostridium perfringens]
NHIKGDEGDKPNTENKDEVIDQPNNQLKEESSIENSNNEDENIETPKSGDLNTTPVEVVYLTNEENLDIENINENELN